MFTRFFRWPLLYPLIGALGAGIIFAWWRMPADEARRWSYGLCLLAVFIALAALGVAARRTVRADERWTPLLLAAGALLVAVGQLIGPGAWFIGKFHFPLGGSALFFLLGHLALSAGLLTSGGRYPRDLLSIASVFGDVCITGIVFILIVSERMLNITLLPHGTQGADLIALAYRGGILLTLICLVIGMSATTQPYQRGPRRLLLLGTGLVLGGGAVLGQVSLLQTAWAFPFSLLFWAIGFPLLGTAALWEHAALPRDAVEARDADEYLSTASLLVPGVLLTAEAIILLIAGREVLHSPNALLVYRLLVLLMLLVVARFIVNVLRSRRAYTALLERVRESERMSVTDMLTGLANKRACLQRMEDELARAKRYKRPYAIIFCDIDFFKLVNDVHGHAVGDMALMAVGKCLRSRIRTTDLVARLGGEEFVLILPETTTAQAGILAERLRKAVEELQIFLPSGLILHLTISLGIAGYPETSDDVETLLANADSAMHHAKETGRNRVVTAWAKVSLFSVVEN